MLKFLRGRKRTRNAVLVIFIGLLTLSLVALFSASGSGAKMFGGAVGSDTAIARVGSYEVTAQDLKAALTNFGQQISQGQGRQAKQDLSTLYDMYGPQVLDGLIRQKLILYQAERLNLGASDSEVQSRLRQMFNPWPGAEAYRLRLQQYQPGMTPVRFEDELRGSIAQEHLRSFITAAVSVDPKEVEEDYRRNNSSYEVRWVDVDPNAFATRCRSTSRIYAHTSTVTRAISRSPLSSAGPVISSSTRARRTRSRSSASVSECVIASTANPSRRCTRRPP